MKILTILSLLLLGACAHMQDSEDGTRTAGEQAAYEQCLQDNMAVAIAWEVIEQQCAASVSGSTDPLELR